MADHDGSYKLLFSQPRMVGDLIRGFISEPWVRQLDFSTLERVPASYVSEGLQRRHNDLVWRLRWGKEDWLYVYLLFEFQSAVDRYMAARMLGYVALLYQDLLRRRDPMPKGLLPPVLPLVIYNGQRRWWAAREIADLIAPAPPGLVEYQPRLRYFVVDEGRLSVKALGTRGNVAAHLFRLERSRHVQEVRSTVEGLAQLLAHEHDRPLRRAFSSWITRALLPGRFGSGAELGGVELEEIKAMLEQTVRRWTREWKREGLQKGMQEGLIAGQAQALARILERRFGALPARFRRRIAAADGEVLLTWVDRAITASTLREVFEP